MKTQAAVLFEQKKPLKIIELDVPNPRRGQVLVKIIYSGICGTQINEIQGLKGEDKWLPHCLGHEGVAEVLETGPDVTKVAVGDKVVLTWLKGSGIEAGGATYSSDGQTINSGPVHTFQKHALISENRLVPLPAGTDEKSAILLGCAFPTGVGSVFNVLKLNGNETVCVFGAGGIGLASIGASKSLGCALIVAVDPNASRRALARDCGATHSLDPMSDDFDVRIEELKGNGFDAVVEATGKVEVMNAAFRSVRPRGGRCVIIGNSKTGDVVEIDPVHFNMGKNLLGSWGGECTPDTDIPRYAELISSGKIQVKHLLSKSYSLDQINLAVADLISGSVGRPVIDMSAGE